MSKHPIIMGLLIMILSSLVLATPVLAGSDKDKDKDKNNQAIVPQSEELTHLRGQVDVMPDGLVGDWVVSGTTVHVTTDTVFKHEGRSGSAGVGSHVTVFGFVQANGSIMATGIHIRLRHPDVTKASSRAA